MTQPAARWRHSASARRLNRGALKVRLPRTGNLYQFNRLMSGGDALEIDATFVRLELGWFPLAAAGLLLLPLGGFVALRFRRA